ncbi:MAG: hypothetical protein NTW73_00020, partial [Candidatus Parcubacteria bacterium]|nr:hypothetical protein [Candidatus Parcubacteria bacterium]
MSFESLTPKSPSPEPEKPPQKPNEQKLTIANDGSGIVNVNINMLGNESKPPRKRTPKITNPDDPDKPPKKSSPKTTPKPEPQPSQSLDTTTPDTVNPQQKQGLDTTTPDTANLQQKQSISLLGGALKFVTMMVGDESDKTKNLLSHLEAEGILSDIPLDLPEMLNNASKD